MTNYTLSTVTNSGNNQGFTVLVQTEVGVQPIPTGIFDTPSFALWDAAYGTFLYVAQDTGKLIGFNGTLTQFSQLPGVSTFMLGNNIQIQGAGYIQNFKGEPGLALQFLNTTSQTYFSQVLYNIKPLPPQVSLSSFTPGSQVTLFTQESGIGGNVGSAIVNVNLVGDTQPEWCTFGNIGQVCVLTKEFPSVVTSINCQGGSSSGYVCVGLDPLIPTEQFAGGLYNVGNFANNPDGTESIAFIMYNYDQGVLPHSGIYILRGNASGYAGSPYTVSSPEISSIVTGDPSFPITLNVADPNGDGFIDLITMEQSSVFYGPMPQGQTNLLLNLNDTWLINGFGNNAVCPRGDNMIPTAANLGNLFGDSVGVFAYDVPCDNSDAGIVYLFDTKGQKYTGVYNPSGNQLSFILPPAGVMLLSNIQGVGDIFEQGAECFAAQDGYPGNLYIMCNQALTGTNNYVEQV